MKKMESYKDADIQKHLIISVKEARKLLGKESKSLNDDNLMRIIMAMEQIAPVLLTKYSVPKNMKA